jgi:predicted DNA-binding transcriptional regulator AlpA
MLVQPPKTETHITPQRQFDSGVKLLSLKQVCEVLCVGRTFVYDRVAQGLLPRPLKLSAGRRGAVRWIESEILHYIAQKSASRQEVTTSK